MKLASTPLHLVAPGDRVISRTGMSGRIGLVLRAGDASPLPADAAGDVDEPRIVILWGSGKWTCREHHLLTDVTHDVEETRDLTLLPAIAARAVAPPVSAADRRELARQLADGLRDVLASLRRDEEPGRLRLVG